jgi:DNA-binding LytR/AlgR family response regulator
MNNTNSGQIKLLANQEQISHLIAQKNYTTIHFADGSTKTIAYNLKKVEDYLSNNFLFKRVHKSYMINKNFVEKISDDGNRLKMIDKTIIPIANQLDFAV